MEIDATRMRAELADVINSVAFGKQRVRVLRHGKSVAAIIPVEDLEDLEALEDSLDLAAVRKALAKGGRTVPWEKIKAELGL